jgi:hypothetical protein
MKNKVAKIALLVCCLVLVLGLFTACYFQTYTNPDGVRIDFRETEGGVAIRSYSDRIGVRELNIPDTINGKKVVEIADFGVVNTEQLHVIRIGRYVERIGPWAFTNNINLLRFEVDCDNEHFTTFEGALYTIDKTELLFYPTGKVREWYLETREQRNALRGSINRDRSNEDEVFEAIKELTVPVEVPEGVKIIRENAFYKNWFLGLVNLPSTLEEIGDGAFLLNGNLQEIVFPEGLLSIGKDAFLGCTSLRRIEIPASVEYVGAFAFFNCWRVRVCIVNRTREETADWHSRWNRTQNNSFFTDDIRFLCD